MADTVNHPAHYNIPGRKECIEEMIDRFGVEAVISFLPPECLQIPIPGKIEERR